MSNQIFISENKKYAVEIESKLLGEILLECKKSSNYETGGILIGNYSDDMTNAVIRSISKAPSDSIQKKRSFRRGIKGLIDMLDNKWDHEGEYYLGEWHFHPNSSSQPSYIDIKQMMKLSSNEKLKCPEPVLLIIGGNNVQGWDISLHVIQNNEVIELFQFT